MNLTRLLAIVFVIAVVVKSEAQTQKEITIEEFASKLRESPDAQILDVRTKEEFAENHLAGAISLSVVDSIAFWRGIEKLNRRNPVFVYSINNVRSQVVSAKLRGAGFEEVYQLPGGIAAWLGKGYPVVANVHQVTSDSISTIINQNNVVLVSIGSKYCGSCKKISPIVKEIKTERATQLTVATVELYQNNSLANQFKIEAVPTLILFKGNKEVWRNSGYIPKEKIDAALNSVVGGL